MIAFNKWDLVDADRRYYLDKEIDRELRRIPWAIRLNLSAMTGRAVDKLAPALRKALASWETRVPTAQLNQWLTALVQATPHPVRGGRAPRILFATQAGVGAAALRALHHRSAGRRLPALRRAQAPRGVRLRGQPDRDLRTPPQEARPRRPRQGARLSSSYVPMPGGSASSTRHHLSTHPPRML